MANARNSGQLQRNFRSNNQRFERNESLCSVWEEVHDPLSRSASTAPFAANDNYDDEISEDLFVSNEYSDDDQDLAISDQMFDSAMSLDQITTTTAAVQQPFILYEPWLQPTSLLILKIITDNSSNRDQAKNILRKTLKWTDEQETGPFDWHLGLSLISLEFKSAKLIDLRMLIESSPQIPCWWKLKTEEIFGKRPKTRKIKTDKSTIKFENPTYAFSLSYGALINLNKFVSCPERFWTHEQFHKCSLHIQDGSRKSSRLDWTFEDRRKDRLSNRLSLMNINECVIIDLYGDGFAIYIEQRCNMSDYRGSIADDNTKNFDGHGPIQRTTSEAHHNMRRNRFGRDRPPGMFGSKPAHHNNNNVWVTYDQYKREGRRLSAYFPTVRFTLRHKQSLSHDSSRIIQQTLTKLIQLFHSNDITICFGRIYEEKDPNLKQYLERPIPHFIIGDFLMEYGWQMLMTSSYRFHLHLDDRLIQLFENIIANEGPRTDQNLFYRICVYLIRILQSRPFLNMTETLDKFVREFDRKKKASSYGIDDILCTDDLDWQYIPSVTITPTVLRVNPLKLCRTNRVLRDPFFGSALYNFALVDIREENGQQLLACNFEDLQCFLLDYLKCGFYLGNQRCQYCYLHHTQSQLRQKQFWFYYNDKRKDEKTIYDHLGDFSKERNPAKYAARVAQSFSTTTQTIKVPQGNVGEISDIYTRDKKLNFSDGCGTMSEALRNEIKKFLGKRDNFSVVQIRYAGAKGVVSVDNRLQGKIKMNLRKSMIKFDCPNHSYFEVCKLSAARPAFLNRQAILLLSNRKIPDATFLTLQQRNYHDLARHLLRNNDAKRCIFSKIPSFLLTPDIDCIKIDYIHEPFFRQLLINTSAQAARALLNKTRIRLPTNLGRYMFGIVDEYDVLKPGEVFIQYTVLADYDSSGLNNNRVGSIEIVKDCEVVITKNPCHHPGDVRRFKAADYPQLRHLKDVLVFSQQGDRPPTHDISGSDLDGDEYLVVWHPDLVPKQTENYPPYDYDSDIPPEQHSGPIDRDVINKKVLDIAKLDCLGLLSKLHLAYADKFGVNDEKTLKIAKAVSQELDSAKTGYHPYTNEKINRLSDKLEKKRPDFFNDPTFESYQSKEILGQLYRASKRTLKEWNRLFRYHRHLRHLQIRTYDDDAMEEEAVNNEEDPTMNLDESFYSDINTQHENYEECAVFAKDLALLYRAEMLELLNLYGLTHESDVWCQNSVNSAKGELEDSAFTELYQLVKRTRTMLYYFQVEYCEKNCEQNASFDDLCRSCQWRQRIVAVECYRVCYQDASTHPQAAPILSLPWIFSQALLQGRLKNPRSILPVLGTRIGNTLHYQIFNGYSLFLTGTHLTFSKRHARIAPIIVDIRVCAFIEILQRSLKKNIDQTRWMFVLKEFIMKECQINGIYQRISADDEWLLVLEPKKVDINDDYAALLLSLNWDEENDEELHRYFQKLIDICFELCRKNDDMKFLDISEKIILLLQKLVIDQTLGG